tara:strand:+ start:8115 stop:8333 length:219 start_codon:yes stop_codon:yes gene_type:complete
MKTKKIDNTAVFQRDKVRDYLDQNVSLMDLTYGPTEFTERWLYRFNKRGEDYRALPTDIMKFYIERTRMLTL